MAVFEDSYLIQLISVVQRMKNIWEQNKNPRIKKAPDKKNPKNEKYKLMYFVPYMLFVFIY